MTVLDLSDETISEALAALARWERECLSWAGEDMLMHSSRQRWREMADQARRAYDEIAQARKV